MCQKTKTKKKPGLEKWRGWRRSAKPSGSFPKSVLWRRAAKQPTRIRLARQHVEPTRRRGDRGNVALVWVFRPLTLGEALSEACRWSLLRRCGNTSERTGFSLSVWDVSKCQRLRQRQHAVPPPDPQENMNRTRSASWFSLRRRIHRQTPDKASPLPRVIHSLISSSSH